jgi:hypothetical protein
MLRSDQNNFLSSKGEVVHGVRDPRRAGIQLVLSSEGGWPVRLVDARKIMLFPPHPITFFGALQPSTVHCHRVPPTSDPPLNNNKKSKVIPIVGRGGPHGCETSRRPHFVDSRLTDGGEVVSLTRRPAFTDFC